MSINDYANRETSTRSSGGDPVLNSIIINLERSRDMERKTIAIGNKHYKHYLENYYVTNDGTLARILLNENEDVVYFKPLKPFRSTFGHLRVEIKVNTKPVKVLLHRVVYEVWVGELVDGMVIEHLDGVPSNNHYSNLKQSTQKENIHTAIAQGRFEQMWHSKTNILVYDKLTGETKGYESVKDFLIDIKAPEYIIRHGGLSSLRKRAEYANRFIVEKIGNKGRSPQTIENII